MEGPRRLPKPSDRMLQAIVLGLVLQVALSGLSLAVQPSGGASSGVPDRFSAPQVAAGDSAVYAVNTGPDGERPVVGDDELVAVTAGWGEPTRSLAADGTYPWTIPLTLLLDFEPRDSDGPLPDGTPSPGGDLSVDLSLTVDYRVGSWTSAGTSVEVHSERGAEVVDALDIVFRTGEDIRWREDLNSPATPCGWHAPFHGSPTNVTHPLTSVGDCPGPNATLAADSVERVEGVGTVRFASQGSAGPRVWYAPGYPLPVKWSGPLAALGLGLEEQATLVMAGYDEGGGTPGTAPADAPTPWTVPTAPQEAWGPRERGLENVTFPLSDAYRTLLNRSEEVRGFREDHPDAYVARGWMYRDRDAANRPRTTWQIVLSDGDDRIERFVGRSAPVGSPTTGPAVQPPAHVWTRDEAPVDAPPLPSSYPHPSDRPPQLPVVHGEVLGSGTEGGYHPWEDPQPGYYAFEIACDDERCGSAEAVVEVGSMPPGTEEAAGQPRWSTNATTTVAGLTPDGRISYLRGTNDRASSQLYQDGGSPHAHATPGTDAGSRGLAFPDAETAAGISLVALLTSTLYYLWPKVKVLGASLYSRIGRDPADVLENDTRQRLFDIIEGEPGIHFRELRRRLETGAGLLEHHLEKLERAALVTEEAGDGYRCYFPSGRISRQVRKGAGTVRADSAREILGVLTDDDGLSGRAVADEVDLSPSAVSYHVDKLADAGFVAKDEDGQSLAIRLTTLGHRAVDELGLG